MTEAQQCFGEKVSRLKATYGMDDKHARDAAAKMFPGIYNQLIREDTRRRVRPGRINTVSDRTGCDYETAAEIVDHKIDALDVKKLHPVDDAELRERYPEIKNPSRPGGMGCPRPSIPRDPPDDPDGFGFGINPS